MESEEQEGELQIVKCCSALLLHSSSSQDFVSRQWQEGEQQLQAAVKALGERKASPILLDFLRRPHLPDRVMDALSHSIALCCGSCSAPPSMLTFKFSPLLSLHIFVNSVTGKIISLKAEYSATSDKVKSQIQGNEGITYDLHYPFLLGSSWRMGEYQYTTTSKRNPGAKKGKKKSYQVLRRAVMRVKLTVLQSYKVDESGKVQRLS